MNGLLCLTWNNHYSTFLKLLTSLYLKDLYCDATIACHGKYYPVHRLVLSTCSEYFEEIFGQTKCKHPFIILKDIKPLELEALLTYMYKGEVNVSQESLPDLIKAAEGLQIRGLAVSDEIPEKHLDANEEKNDIPEEVQTKGSKRRRTSKSSNETNLSFESEDMENSNNAEEIQRSSNSGSLKKLSSKELKLCREATQSMEKAYSFERQGSLEQAYNDYHIENSHQDLEQIKTEVIDAPSYADTTGIMPPQSMDLPQEQTFCSAFTSDELISKEEQYDSFCSQAMSIQEGNFTKKEDVQSQILGSISERASESSSSLGYVKPPDQCHPEDPLFLSARTSAVSSYRNQMTNNSDDPLNVSESLPCGLPQNFKCPRCPYEAKKKYNLKSHFMYKHSSIRPVCCQFCSFRCILKSDLKRHMNKHIR